MSIPTNKNIKAVSYNGTNIPLVGGSSTLQEKTVSPSVSAQEVTADAGYDGLSKVTVNAMPSGALSNPTVNTSTGVVTAQIGTSGYLASGTNTTLALTTQGAKTVTPSASSQTAVASGRYTTGAVTVAGDANLVAGNIKSGVSIFGVSGSYGSMNIQTNKSMITKAQTSLGTTGLSLTVAQTGTYTISWMAARGSSTGTMSTRLYVNSSAKDTDRTTWTNTYGQQVTITGFSLTAGQTVEVYARSGSTSRYVMVGNLIIEQTA